MTIAIVTGGSRGLGASTSVECETRSMGVIITYNSNREKAEDVLKAIAAIGGNAAALKLDVGNSRSFPEVRKAVSAQLKVAGGYVI